MVPGEPPTRKSPYRDYYFWREPTQALRRAEAPQQLGQPVRGQGAGSTTPCSGEYYLHIFANKQPDLNYGQPRASAQEVKNIMRFWLDMGVDGFREDVITYISKTPGTAGRAVLYAHGARHFPV